MVLKAFFLAAFLCCLPNSDASSWGYGTTNGPSTWAKDYKVCGNGGNAFGGQSPVDLVPTVSYKLPNLNFTSNWWDDRASGKLFNNGHTVEFEVTQPNPFTFVGGPFGPTEYQFLQLHFHWGSDDSKGSEHALNGTKFPLEMHMVCINSKYVGTDGTLDDAYLTKKDGVAVLGVMFVLSDKDYAPLTSITRVIADAGGLKDQAVGYEVENVEVDIGGFVASVIRDGYYAYSGSFTTPGCNEVVTWCNFKEPIEISTAQLATFRTLKDSDGNMLADNFRPIQKSGGRPITLGTA